MAQKMFNIRLSDAELKSLERAAKRRALSKSALIRRWIAEREKPDDIEVILRRLRSNSPDVDIDLLAQRQKNPPRSPRSSRARHAV
ncbi:MAG: CopG family transcriptional regulator [Opitutaceae bacterium]